MSFQAEKALSREHSIPKRGVKHRLLGILMMSGRVAQAAIKLMLEAAHPDGAVPVAGA